MLTVIAILLAWLLLPSPWGFLVVAAALLIDIAEILVWLRLRGRRSITGAEGLIGARAVTATVCRPEGRVRLQGQIWKATCPKGVGAGIDVIVTAVDELVLTVAPVRNEERAAV